MEDLPDEVINYMLQYLEFDEDYTLKCVSKRLHHTVHMRTFPTLIQRLKLDNQKKCRSYFHKPCIETIQLGIHRSMPTSNLLVSCVNLFLICLQKILKLMYVVFILPCLIHFAILFQSYETFNNNIFAKCIVLFCYLLLVMGFYYLQFPFIMKINVMHAFLIILFFILNKKNAFCNRSKIILILMSILSAAYFEHIENYICLTFYCTCNNNKAHNEATKKSQ